MTWVSWRLQRTETAVAAGILLLVAALLVPTGITMAHAYAHDGVAGCLISTPLKACPQLDAFRQRFDSLVGLLNWFTLLPGLIGVLLAAPFVLELEQGTYRLAWTQSVTRGRWLTAKLALPIVCAIVAGGVLIALLTWWRVPYVHLQGRLETGTYDSEGIVAVGFTLFALGAALAIGAVWRRTGMALTVGFVAYFAMRFFGDTWLRDRLVAPRQITWRGPNQPHVLDTAKVITQTVVGHPNTATQGSFAGGSQQVAVPGDIAKTVFHVVYQPASHFWPMQLAETGIYLGAAAALIGFAAWWTLRRAA